MSSTHSALLSNCSAAAKSLPSRSTGGLVSAELRDPQPGSKSCERISLRCQRQMPCKNNPCASDVAPPA